MPDKQNGAEQNPEDLAANLKLLTEREFAVLFASAAVAPEGITHEAMEKILANFEDVKAGMWLLSMMSQGKFLVSWDDKRGDVVHKQTTPAQEKQILAALAHFDKLGQL